MSVSEIYVDKKSRAEGSVAIPLPSKKVFAKDPYNLLAQRAGFSEVAEIRATKLISEERSRLLKALGFEEISIVDYEIWKKFLPTGYGYAPSDRRWWNGARGSYKFDYPPVPILEWIGEVLEGGMFSGLEIRTTEAVVTPKNLDPALFGVLSDPTQIFLLARWGESDANLITFEEIKQLVLAKK